MIDINSEKLIQFRDLPAYLQKILGRRPSLSTLQRWRLKGSDGVKLETIRIGGNRFTSAEALNRYFAQKTAAADGDSVANVATQAQADESQSYLASEGFTSPAGK